MPTKVSVFSNLSTATSFANETNELALVMSPSNPSMKEEEASQEFGSSVLLISNNSCEEGSVFSKASLIRPSGSIASSKGQDSQEEQHKRKQYHKMPTLAQHLQSQRPTTITCPYDASVSTPAPSSISSSISSYYDTSERLTVESKQSRSSSTRRRSTSMRRLYSLVKIVSFIRK